MKTLFVILLLSISTVALSQQVPSKIGSTAQQPTAAVANSTSSSTGCSPETPIIMEARPLGAGGNPTADLEILLHAQTNMIRALTTQIETLSGQINQLETSIEKTKQGTE